MILSCLVEQYSHSHAHRNAFFFLSLSPKVSQHTRKAPENVCEACVGVRLSPVFFSLYSIFVLFVATWGAVASCLVQCSFSFFFSTHRLFSPRFIFIFTSLFFLECARVALSLCVCVLSTHAADFSFCFALFTLSPSFFFSSCL